MNRRLIDVAMLVVLAVAAMQAQPRETPSAAAAGSHSPVATAQFGASTDESFEQLMDEAMTGMRSVPQTGDPDRDFVTMMIAHHQGAIDMAKARLLYGADEQVKRLAQEVIADQQNEVQLMQLWLAKHPAGAERRNINDQVSEEHHR